MEWMLLTIGFLCAALAANLAALAKAIDERDYARELCELLIRRKLWSYTEIRKSDE